jgi:hypothetical protein
MKSYQHRPGWVWTIAVVCLFAWGLSGCSTVGPASIKAGRAVYNEAINRTEDQQLLMRLVHTRYGETSSMLAVTSVTANVRVTTNAGINIGFGPDENYAGNLVPFSGGVVYEENPTISYTPIHGEEHVRQLMSPIPLDLLVLLVTSVTSRDSIMTALVTSLNDIQNPDFLPSPTDDPDRRFARVVELMMSLSETGYLVWVEDQRKEVDFSIVIRGYAPTQLEEVQELLALLGLSVPADVSRDIVLPTFLGLEGRKMGGIAIRTRSIYDLFEIMAAKIDVPEEHAGSGLVVKYPTTGLAGRNVRIRRSEERPKNASVTVKYRGSWFYVDETDQPTKLMFQLMRTLWSVRVLGKPTQFQTAPVLTVPVSR